MEGNTTNNKGLSIASLVLGILSLVGGWIPGVNYIALPCAIVGLVLAIVARKKGKNGLNTAGLVLSIIALALTAVAIICTIACIGAAASAAGGLVNILE